MFQKKMLYPHQFCRRRQIKRVSLLALFFCLLALASSYAWPFGQPSFPGIKVNGRVTSSLTKQGIPNATVSATDAKGAILSQTKTNHQGYYQVSVLSGSVKTIFVRIEVTGYQSQYKGGALSPYRTYTIDFSLTSIKPSPPPKADKIPPTGHIAINKNQRFTNSPQVTLSLLARDDRGGNGLSQMRFSNDNQAWSIPEAYTISKAWVFSSGDGSKAVYVKFADQTGNWSRVYSDTIILDTVAPKITSTSPGNNLKFYEQGAILISSVIDDNGISPVEYQFSIDAQIKQAWGTQASYNWIPQEIDAGERIIKIEVRDTGGSDAKNISAYVLKNPIAPPG